MPCGSPVRWFRQRPRCAACWRPSRGGARGRPRLGWRRMPELSQADRDRFDALVERAIESLPDDVRARLDIVSVVVLDEPTDDMLADIGVNMNNSGEVA